MHVDLGTSISPPIATSERVNRQKDCDLADFVDWSDTLYRLERAYDQSNPKRSGSWTKTGDAANGKTVGPQTRPHDAGRVARDGRNRLRRKLGAGSPRFERSTRRRWRVFFRRQPQGARYHNGRLHHGIRGIFGSRQERSQRQ